MLKLNLERCGPWEIHALRFVNERSSLSAQVIGMIGNSITTSPAGKLRTVAWRIAVAEAVRSTRTTTSWITSERYAISLAFAFHPPSHGSQLLDIENFLKPTLDAIACGLFGSLELELATLARWHFDDSRFQHLLVHRAPDASAASGEGMAFFVSGA